MRIGIITHHWVYNFGANLQALSSNRILKNMGHDVWIINYRPLEKENWYKENVPPEQANAHERFCKEYMNQTPLCRTEDDLIGVCKEYKFDEILLGSDAMLKLDKDSIRTDKQFPNPYWLEWVEAAGIQHKATLAVSSMGTNFIKYPGATRNRISQALESFTNLYVRDRWTFLMILLVSQGRCRPKLCPDPVFILNDIVDLPDMSHDQFPFFCEKYILLSHKEKFFPDGWVSKFTQLAHKNGKMVVSLPFPEKKLNLFVDYVVPLPLNPLSWYSIIKNSCGYIGYRMHPIVCSIANDVPFISIDTYSTSKIKTFDKLSMGRFSSKTFDLCALAGMQKFCLPSKSASKYSPEEIYHLLHSEEQKKASRFAGDAKNRFYTAVNQILLH